MAKQTLVVAVRGKPIINIFSGDTKCSLLMRVDSTPTKVAFKSNVNHGKTSDYNLFRHLTKRQLIVINKYLNYERILDKYLIKT
jgi:hypothetical protein